MRRLIALFDLPDALTASGIVLLAAGLAWSVHPGVGLAVAGALVIAGGVLLARRA